MRPGVEQSAASAQGGDGEAGQHPDRRRRSSVATAVVRSDVADRAQRVDAGADPGADLGPSEGAPRRQRVPTAAAAQRSLDQGDERREGDHRRDRGDRGDERPARRGDGPVAAGRAAAARAPAVPPLLREPTMRPATPTATSCSTASVAAAPMSPICVACRQTSTSIVAVPASPSTRITPNEVNVNTKTIDAGGEDGRAQQRQRDLAERPPRRGAERGGGSLQVGREVVPHRADGAHDDGEVEDDVGQQDRPDAAFPAVGQQGEHRRAHHHRRQHEHRGEQGVEQRAARRTRTGR